MSFKVASKRCNQCLFSADKIVSDKRRQEVLEECARQGEYFICHKGTIAGIKVCCRGFFDAPIGHTSQVVRIAQRIESVAPGSIVEEIDPDELSDSDTELAPWRSLRQHQPQP